MKKTKGASKEGKGGDSPSRLIDARIKELSDWRGETLARIRIASPWRYDAAACHALQSITLRRPAILHYAQRAGVFPISQRGPLTLR